MLSLCWYNNTEYKNLYEYLDLNMTEAVYSYILYEVTYDLSSLQEVVDSGDGPLNYTYMAEKTSIDPHKKAVFDACVVQSTPLAYSNLNQFLYNFFDGNVTGQHIAHGGSNGIPNPGKLWASTLIQYSTVWLDPLYNNGAPSSGNTQALMDRLADSMTNYMRTADQNSSNIIGEVNGVQTCVRVEWPWLALPAVLVVATCLLLVATIVATARKANANVWKSSPLAYLFHGFTDEARMGAQGGLITVDEMDAVAGRKDVVLTERGEGWRFVAEERRVLRGKDG